MIRFYVKYLKDLQVIIAIGYEFTDGKMKEFKFDSSDNGRGGWITFKKPH